MAWTKTARTQITGLSASGTTDDLGSWNTSVSLSAFVTVPSGATAVILEIKQNSSSPQWMGTRETGETTAMFVEDRSRSAPVGFVPLNGGTTIDLYLENTTNCTFWILGFTNTETVFFERDSRPSVTSNSGTWADRDVSAAVPAGATAVLAMCAVGVYKWRPKGSSVDRGYGANTANGIVPAIIKLDANRVFQIASASANFSLLGYYTGGIQDDYDHLISTTADDTWRASLMPNAGKTFAFGVQTLNSGSTGSHQEREAGSAAGHSSGSTGSVPRAWITPLDSNGEFEYRLPTSSTNTLRVDGWLYDSVVKKLKLTAHASAAGATGVSGIVFAAPAGGDITGAVIGEFTNKSFETELEGGQAVLKVPVADFGGGALTVSDTPVALAKNASNTTGIKSCTVIEE